MTIREHLDTATRLLTAAGIPDARRDAMLLLQHTSGRSREFLFANPDHEFTDDVMRRFRDLTERRSNREPLQYLIGEWQFYGLGFHVRPSVLIPRPETEILVEHAIDHARDLEEPTFAEIGVGSGCISVSLLVNLPTARAVATDISADAISIAAENAARHRVGERIRLVNTDIFDGIDEQFDIIVSNPPYIPVGDASVLQPEVTDHEPHEALFSGTDGLDVVRRIAADAHAYLKPGGLLLIEIGHDQSELAAQLFDERLYTPPSFLLDLQNIPRILHTFRR